jgi:carboxyl-terminal processing protease
MYHILLFISLLAFQNLAFSQDDELKKSLEKIDRLFYLLNNNYVEKIIPNNVAENAIKGALKELDPHSYYLTADEIKEANESLQGNFEGIGIQYFLDNDTMLILSAIPDSPAEKAGVIPGDRLIYVDDSLVAGNNKKSKDFSKFLKGKKGSEITLKLLRKNTKDLITISMKRDKIPVSSIPCSYMINSNTGFIKVTKFTATTMNDIDDAFRKLKKAGMDNLILDLQDNSGGYLMTAIDMADEFIDDKKTIVYTEGYNSPRKDYDSRKKGSFETGNLVVLIDEGSASASEIVAGAIQDLDRGIIIGRRSFGKGLVQNTYYFSDGSAVRITTARYHTPSGRCIQRPYDKGKDKYYEDLRKRLERGELVNQDSIKFPDSLKYFTGNHRIVYGGGGIMPDLFVPFDTISNDTTIKKLNAKNLVYTFAVHYIDDNREVFNEKYKTFEIFEKDFKVNSDIISSFSKYLKSKNLILDFDKLSTPVKKNISISIIANIARVRWDQREYTIIRNKEDFAVRKALDVLSGMNTKSILGFKE